MPYAGGTSFLLEKIRQYEQEQEGVNALCGRDFISTFHRHQAGNRKEALCQCPMRAGLHFYLTNMSSDEVQHMCQCPMRAGLHCYDGHYEEDGREGRVSMPYAGGTSFLQWRKNEVFRICAVSMPYAGGTSFLLHSWGDPEGKKRRLCQCPMRAGLHFYIEIMKQFIVIGVCQCPMRAGLHFYLSGRLLTLSSPSRVSMPYAGGTSFLLLSGKKCTQNLNMCQCPMRAGLHFYYA